MKALLFGLLLLTSISAKANNCSTAMDTMTIYYNIYLKTMSACYELEKTGDINGQAYKMNKNRAEFLMDEFPEVQTLCFKSCGPISSCEGHLEEICPIR